MIIKNTRRIALIGFLGGFGILTIHIILGPPILIRFGNGSRMLDRIMVLERLRIKQLLGTFQIPVLLVIRPTSL